MNSGRRLWWAVTGPIWVASSAVAVAMIPPSAVITVAVFVGITATALGLVAEDEGIPRQSLIDATRRGFIATAATVGVLGLLAILGGLGVLVAVVLGGTSPAAIRQLRRTWRLRQWERNADECARWQRAHPALIPVSTLSTPELIGAWRTSLHALHQADNSSTTAQIVDRRRCYLEELERRYPEGVRRWLMSGPNPTRDPAPYLQSNTPGEHPA